jgi:hypothetical protein
MSDDSAAILPLLGDLAAAGHINAYSGILLGLFQDPAFLREYVETASPTIEQSGTPPTHFSNERIRLYCDDYSDGTRLGVTFPLIYPKLHLKTRLGSIEELPDSVDCYELGISARGSFFVPGLLTSHLYARKDRPGTSIHDLVADPRWYEQGTAIIQQVLAKYDIRSRMLAYVLGQEYSAGLLEEQQQRLLE